MQYKCLSIAGFDGSGGAGLQADLKTFAAFGCYGMTVLTALPVQNTCGVRSCYALPLQSIEEQLAAIFDDIRPDAIKMGMLFSKEVIDLIAYFLERHRGKIPIVVDPVMVAKSGHSLLQVDAITALKEKILPQAALITPNIPEACTLLSQEESPPETMLASLLALGSEAILLKGGHQKGTDSNDFFLDKEGRSTIFQTKRIPSKNTHGTGCTLSAAITACLARGFSVLEACGIAKRYLTAAMQASMHQSVGKGQGPLYHAYHLEQTINQWLATLAP